MNHIQLSGTIAGRPAPIYDGTSIRFYLRARHPPAPDFPSGIVDVPYRFFEASPEQRKILLGENRRNGRVEAAGRLEKIISDGGRLENGGNNRQQKRSLEMIVSPQGLQRQRGR